MIFSLKALILAQWVFTLGQPLHISRYKSMISIFCPSYHVKDERLQKERNLLSYLVSCTCSFSHFFSEGFRPLLHFLYPERFRYPSVWQNHNNPHLSKAVHTSMQFINLVCQACLCGSCLWPGQSFPTFHPRPPRAKSRWVSGSTNVQDVTVFFFIILSRHVKKLFLFNWILFFFSPKCTVTVFSIILIRHVKKFFLFDWILLATSILKHPAWPVLDTSGGEKQVSGGYQRLVWWKRGQHLRFSRLKVFGIMKVLVVYFRFVVNLMNAMRLGALLAGWRSSRWL